MVLPKLNLNGHSPHAALACFPSTLQKFQNHQDSKPFTNSIYTFLYTLKDKIIAAFLLIAQTSFLLL